MQIIELLYFPAGGGGVLLLNSSEQCICVEESEGYDVITVEESEGCQLTTHINSAVISPRAGAEGKSQTKTNKHVIV